MTPERLLAEFPAPSFRGAQRDACERIRDAFEAGNEVVLVRAPTGSGKSLLARAVMGTARTVEEAAPADPTGAYYTTPQVSQLDDVAADDLLDDLSVVRGKSNYTCILRGERDVPVDRARCARETGFDCPVEHKCPYFSDRAIASNRRYAAMTLAYFMRTAGSDAFGTRDVVVVDEAHGLAEWAEMYATIELGPSTVPVWDDVEVPDVEDLPRAVRFAEGLCDLCGTAKDRLVRQAELTPAEAARRDRLQERISELQWFVEDARDPESPTTWLLDQHNDGSLSIKPLNPARFLRHTVWDRGQRFCLLSATILEKEAFCRSVGLDPARVALVDVEHTFPLANRPLYDVTVGKMTYEHREQTLPDLASTLVRVMAAHPDEKGIVHAHSYGIQGALRERLDRMGVGARVVAHDRETRDDALQAWKDSDDPLVFLSVKMEEALDLADELARWQLLCKAPFANTSDSRVARRLADGQWGWYYRSALRTVIQACGRVVRSPDDHGATYVGDASVLDLFDRARSAMPPWFAEQVDAMSRPDLPTVDPAAALAGVDASADPTGGGRARQSEESSSTGGGGRSSTGGGGRSSTGGTGTGGGRRRRSPMADVWDSE
ncbi:MAG: helicase C-terminal domain-containing protein [Halobacteriaceae archaeon]